jgi:diaminopimelate decarboxylase
MTHWIDRERLSLDGCSAGELRFGVTLPAAPTGSATVVGRHCEAGNVLVPDATLPADIRGGDLLAMLCIGAYHHTMGSNYNLVARPPVVAVHDAKARLLVRRETATYLLSRDLGE